MERTGRSSLRSLFLEESMVEEKQNVFQQFGKGTPFFLGDAGIWGTYTNERVVYFIGHQDL